MIDFSVLEFGINTFIFSLIIGGGIFLYYGFEYRKHAGRDKIALLYHGQTIADDASLKITSLVSSTRDLVTRSLTPDSELTHSASEIGLANIEYLLKQIIGDDEDPVHLFGINKGGALIANFLLHRIGLHQKYLVKCDYREDLDKIYCEDRKITGSIVIIDDVVRSGNTLQYVEKYIREQYPDSNVYTVVLIAVVNEGEEEKVFELVDYAPWITSNSAITLPWSRDSVAEASEKTYFNDKEMDQIVGRIKSAKRILKILQ